ncbi:Glucosidase 2 subunit beta [Toxocara canis]|uniref:Glucosidase 2 subunit beta n=1 Tax=Toxocara canis TaxID=6265 RepID=A0A0B2V776_TOXCA|nr:Glucosidase 2 subunit beta [Toxocara canis]
MMQVVGFLLISTSLWSEVFPLSLGSIKKTNKEPKPNGYGVRPRGVPFIRGALYATGVNFTCFSGSKMIPFSRVNDDYCDCPDGSDEPGTSACPNGKFHCLNRGYKAIDIPSSRVNDQICDCCDGSDEWDSAVDCPNICDEMGAKWREEIQRRAAVAQKGYAKRLELANEGSKIKAEKEKSIDGLRKERNELLPKRDEAEGKKKEIEEKEREAKDRHHKAWEEERDQKKQAKVIALFGTLDVNSDQKITLDEMKTFKEFDSDNNGEVSDDEAKDYLSGVEESDLEHFKMKVYETIEMLFPDPDDEKKTEKVEGDTEKAEIKDKQSDSATPGENEMSGAEDKGRELEELAELEGEPLDGEHATALPPPPPPPVHSSPSQLHLKDSMPDYDDATKKLMEEADEARKVYNEISDRIRDLDSSIRDAESYLNGDFGVDSAWAPLKGKWLEFDDSQYTYKLCLFDRAVQKEKSGHLETSLGRWLEWSGGDEDKYKEQLYDKGQGCWNGPERSTRVVVECGEETELVDATEPAKCEYRFVLRSPAACPDPATITDVHEEL